MDVIYLVLPIAMVLAGGGLLAFAWCVRRGQYDDLDSPQVRMLFDEDQALPQKKEKVALTDFSRCKPMQPFEVADQTADQAGNDQDRACV